MTEVEFANMVREIMDQIALAHGISIGLKRSAHFDRIDDTGLSSFRLRYDPCQPGFSVTIYESASTWWKPVDTMTAVDHDGRLKSREEIQRELVGMVERALQADD